MGRHLESWPHPVLLYERQQFLYCRPAESVAWGVLPEGQQARRAAGKAQHNAVAIADEDVTVRVACGGDDLELPAIKGVKGVRHRYLVGRTVWVVEGGINVGYRLIAFLMRS